MKNFLLLVALVLLTGCSSVLMHKIDASASEASGRDSYFSPSPIFRGTTADAMIIGRCVASPIRCTYQRHVKWYGILLTPIPVIDLPFSIVADLLFLPSDISSWASSSRSSKTKKTHEPSADVLIITPY